MNETRCDSSDGGAGARSRAILSILVLQAIGLMMSGPAARAQDPDPREIREIASGWRFQVDVRDVGERERWYDVGIDRSSWRAAGVPGAWDLLDEAMRGYEGIGWYAVTLDGSWARAGRAQRLSFGRVMYHARVWLNGELLGEHIDGYLPFTFDVTGKLRSSDNHLVLRVNNRPRIEWPPAAKQIEWVQYGGILQPVRVESTALVSISDLAIRAVPDGNGASVTCAVEVASRVDAGDLVLRLVVVGDEPASRTLAIATRAVTASRHELTLRLVQARTWSPETPALYTLVATLERGTTVIDRIFPSFGIRTVAARGRQILLNGEPLKIKGVNRYDEFGGFGPNPPLNRVKDELRLMKKTGINLIRAHYPQSPEFLGLCDRVGILFLEELPINWWGVEWFGKEGVVQDEHILDLALPMLEAMVRRDRNHPSVIIWSMANESETDNAIGIKVMRHPDRADEGARPDAPGHVRDGPRLGPRAPSLCRRRPRGDQHVLWLDRRDDRRPSQPARRACAAAIGGPSPPSDHGFPGQAARDRRIRRRGDSGDARGRRRDRGFPGRLHPFGLGGDLRRARGVGRRLVVLGRLLSSEGVSGQRRVRGLRRGHRRPPAQGGATGPRRDVRRRVEGVSRRAGESGGRAGSGPVRAAERRADRANAGRSLPHRKAASQNPPHRR